MNLRQYAAEVSAHAEKLQSYLDSQDAAAAAGSPDGNKANGARPPTRLPADLQEARIRLMSACLNLHDLADGPESFVTLFPLTAVHDVGALRVLSHYRIYELVPREGTVSYTELAQSLCLEPHRLMVYMRHLISRRIFHEPSLGQVAHSAASTLIADHESLQGWIAMLVDDTLEAVQALPKTYDQHGLSLDPHQSPFNVARSNTAVSSLELVLSDPKRGARFAKGLEWVPTTALGSTEANLNSYPWDQFSLVVDVGGGSGHFSTSLARRYPEMRFILQDIPAQAALFKPAEDVASRLEFQVHDFFKPQPVHGADAYVLRTILHDWPDDKCAEILQNILPAMKSGARILLVEISLQDPTTAPIAWARTEAAVNSHLHCHCGRERTAADWAYVVELTSPDLEISQIASQPGSLFSVIEIVNKKH